MESTHSRGANKACLIFLSSLLLAACGGGGGGGGPPPTYTIGGTVSGLASGSSVVLQDNGADSVTATSNSAFTFPKAIAVGGTYQVTVATQPPGQTCTVSAGGGSVTSNNVTSVGVTCIAITHTVGGTVSGLADGSSIVLQNNGGDSLTVSANSTFTFATAIATGSNYSVSIGAQPPYQGCSVTLGSGTVANADVTSVVVHCPLAQVLWNFGGSPDGFAPTAPLIQGSDGNFYGTTTSGGPNFWGTVFQISPGGVETVLYSFASGSDGADPVGGVVEASDGNFYGTTYSGGANGLGTVFKVTPAGVETILWSFGSGVDGMQPAAGLIQGSDGNFYGTTSGGGTNAHGTVFKITPAGAETVLWNLGAGSDGYDPESALIQGSDGNFYGTTISGGSNNFGTVYKITPSGVETVLWNFDFTNGSGPQAGLIEGPDGNFYGTTAGGGTNAGGTVFKITPSGVETILWNFGLGADGVGPVAGLVLGRDGNFYGTTAVGGTINNDGTIFKVTPAGVETVMWDFGFGTNLIAIQVSALIQGSDGNFYGTTDAGGTVADGTVFKMTP
jgi:uncharacterized repeat protein (TIGR03803 family)